MSPEALTSALLCLSTSEDVSENSTATKDVTEVPEDIFDVGESSTTAHTTEAFVPMGVVDFSLIVIAENFKGFGGFLEMTFSRFIARIFVRVILESHFSILGRTCEARQVDFLAFSIFADDI